VRGAAPSVVCPRCGNESPPSGAGRFMTCAKCGMSIDSNAGERQEAVRGRVREKPEVVIDPTLAPTPSKFPLGFAITVAVFVAGGIAFLAYELAMRKPDDAAEQRENQRILAAKQKAFAQVVEKKVIALDSPSCKMLVEIVMKPCLPTVNPYVLAFDNAIAAIDAAERTRTCVSAVETFSRSRIDGHCD